MVGYNSASATPGGGGKSDVPTSGANTMDEKTMPKDGRAIISILKDMGITDFEPRVVSQLLEFSYRYISTILEDSRTFSVHARKKGVDLDDVKLAVEMHSDHNLTSPPPRDLLLEVAARRNSIPLPIPKQSGGLKLPPERFCLTNTNYRLKPSKKSRPGAKSQSISGGKGGYGANYGINNMNKNPQATKSQANIAGKITLGSGSSSIGGGPIFTVKPFPNNATAAMQGVVSNTISTPEASPAAFIKINNTASHVDSDGGASSTVPLFSMAVAPTMPNPPITGVKRKAEQMENHE